MLCHSKIYKERITTKYKYFNLLHKINVKYFEDILIFASFVEAFNVNVTKTSISSKITFKIQDQDQAKLITRLVGLNWNPNAVCSKALILFFVLVKIRCRPNLYLNIFSNESNETFDK